MNHDILIVNKAIQVVEAARHQRLRLATVESCTGGLIAASLTEIAGASDVVEGGFITYANSAKMAFVDVPENLLRCHGAVSPEVAIAMAEGGLHRSGTDIVVSVTGIAGPGGGSITKPVGLVHFAVASLTFPTQHHATHFDDLGRHHIRQAAVIFALDFLLECLEYNKEPARFERDKNKQ